MRFNCLSLEQKEELSRIDADILAHADSGRTKEVRRAFRKRGKFFSAFIAKAFTNHESEKLTYQEEKIEAEKRNHIPWQFYAQAFLGVGVMLGDILSGQTFFELRKWQKQGADIKFIIPEFDVMVPLSEIQDFTTSETKVESELHAVIMGATTHNFRYDGQTEGLSLFARALRQVNKQE